MSDAPRMLQTIKAIAFGAAVFLAGGALHEAAAAAGMPHDLVPWLGLIICAVCLMVGLAVQHSHPGPSRHILFTGCWLALGTLAGAVIL